MPEEVIYHVEHHAEITFGFKRDYEQVQLPRNGLGYFAGSFPDGLTTIKGVPSRPSRARGLKPCKPNYCDVTTFASITGAWIETMLIGQYAAPKLFASITGAWIETVTRR